MILLSGDSDLNHWPCSFSQGWTFGRLLKNGFQDEWEHVKKQVHIRYCGVFCLFVFWGFFALALRVFNADFCLVKSLRDRCFQGSSEHFRSSWRVTVSCSHNDITMESPASPALIWGKQKFDPLDHCFSLSLLNFKRRLCCFAIWSIVLPGYFGRCLKFDKYVEFENVSFRIVTIWFDIITVWH